MSGKSLPPPPGSDALTELLRTRHADTDERSAPPPPRQPEPAASKTSTMDRRSWYMPKASAIALADAVDELHFATRQPKHAVMQAIVSVVLQHLDEAQQHLEDKR